MEFVKRRDLYEHKQSPIDNSTNHGISEEGGSLDAHLRRWHRKHNGGSWEITSESIPWLTLEMKSIIHMSLVSVHWASLEITWVQNWISNLKHSAKSAFSVALWSFVWTIVAAQGSDLYSVIYTPPPHKRWTIYSSQFTKHGGYNSLLMNGTNRLNHQTLSFIKDLTKSDFVLKQCKHWEWAWCQCIYDDCVHNDKGVPRRAGQEGHKQEQTIVIAKDRPLLSTHAQKLLPCGRRCRWRWLWWPCSRWWGFCWSSCWSWGFCWSWCWWWRICWLSWSRRNNCKCRTPPVQSIHQVHPLYTPPTHPRIAETSSS